MTNYSETYAAAITTYSPLIVLILGRLGVNILESDVILIIGILVSTYGVIWQLVQRYKKGGITKLGVRKVVSR